MASATQFFRSSSAVSQIFNLIPTPSLFTSNNQYPTLRIPKRTIKFHQLSCSVSSLLTQSLLLKRKIGPLSSFAVSFAPGETSDSAQQDEESIVEREEEQARDDEGAKLFVANLPYDVDHAALTQLFDEGGNVKIAEVIYNRDTNQSRGFGFVTMSSVEEAEKAIDKFHGQRVNGRLLTVNKAAPKGSNAERPPRLTEPIFSLYVGNLSWDIDSARLEEIFSDHGKVVEARIIIDRDTGRSRGFGFVAYSTESEMHNAISTLDGETLDGRPIRVDVAEVRPKRNLL